MDDKGVCINCGNFSDSDALKKVGGKTYCKDCLAELLSKHDEDKAKSASHHQPATQIIIQQQQQQQQAAPAGPSGKAKGSGFWLCFWIVVFWPVAIWYYINRKWD